MKKIGIACDNYKITKFENELSINGFKDYKIKSFTKNIKLIIINVSDYEVNKIKNICQLLEIDFKRRN